MLRPVGTGPQCAKKLHEVTDTQTHRERWTLVMLDSQFGRKPGERRCELVGQVASTVQRTAQGTSARTSSPPL